MDGQGPGYRDYRRWSKWPALRRGRDRAATYILRSRPAPRPLMSGSPLDFLYRDTKVYRVPIVRVHDRDTGHAGTLRPFPKELGLQVLVYSNEHPPPHIHIHVVQDEYWTRYSWPELLPLESEPPLSRKDAAALQKYVHRHGSEIGARIDKIYKRRR